MRGSVAGAKLLRGIHRASAGVDSARLLRLFAEPATLSRMPRRGWSIRWWLAGLVGGVALLLTVWLTFEFLSLEWREPREAERSALRVARLLGTRLRAFHADSLALLDGMAARPEIANFDGGRCDSLIAMIDFFPQYLNLVLFDEAGRVVCAATPQSGDVELSHAALQWVADELRRSNLRPRMPRLRPIRDHWVSVVTRPSAGTFHGTLALVALPEVLGRETLPDGSVITVLDDRGTIVARTGEPQKWVGRNVRGSALARVVLHQKEGHAEIRGVDGIARLYGFTTVSEMGWVVAVGIPTATMRAPARAELVRGITAGALILLILFTVAMLLARAMGRPIDALVRAATAVAHGAYGKVEVEGPSEIATLAEAFNEMVENRSRAEQKMQENERALKALSDRMLVVQEQERTRIAREIHDELGQTLTALKMDVIGLMEKTTGTPSTAAIRQRVLTTLDATVSSVQRISAELRPSILDDLGLAETIESEARAFEERTGIECEVSLPEDSRRVSSVVATTVYRIIQEALTNVARHSNATRVELRLRFRDSAVLIEIRDDGRGITSQEVGSARSLGLIGIRERAEMVGGTTRFEGIAGRGTIISVRIPMPETAS
jgi:signal transduction histidine kinase